MTSTLSYLIENNIKPRVDEKLVRQYEQQNELMTNRKLKKSNQKVEKPPSPVGSYRNKQLKQAPPRTSPQSGGSHSPKLSRPVTRHNILKPPTRDLSPQGISNSLCDREMINLLTSKIESLRTSQRDAQVKYGESIQQLKNELNTYNEEYEQQCQQFQRLKTQIIGTKKDIASLINLVQKNKEEEQQQLRLTDKQIRPVVMRPPTNTGSPRFTLNNFIKMGPNAKQ